MVCGSLPELYLTIFQRCLQYLSGSYPSGAACQAWFPVCPCPVCFCRGDMDLEAAPEASLSIQDEELVARSLARVLTELKVLLYSKYFRRQEHCCPVCPCLVCFRGGDAIPAKLLRMCQVCPVCTEHCAGFSLSTKGNTINSILCFSDHR